MRVLEVRFHPRNSGEFMVVGRVVWPAAPGETAPRVTPAADLAPGDRATNMLDKVAYLVNATAPASFERLQRLDSRYWTFVEVPPGTPEGNA